MITLLSYFTFAEADGGSGMSTPWVPFPSEDKNAEMWIECHTLHTGSVDVKLQTTTDGVTATDVTTATTISAAGVTQAAVADKLGPLVRLFLQESATGAILTLSVWLVPKRSD